MTFSTLRTIALSALAAVTLAGSAAAVQYQTAAVADGTCKRDYIVGMAPSAGAAQAVWSQIAAGTYGNKWAIWVGARNKSVTAHPSGNGMVYRAQAQPCFYQPVP